MADLFVRRVPAADSIALHQFADTEAEIVPFTHDFAVVRQAFNRLNAQTLIGVSKTDMGDALAAILRNSREQLGFGDSIVIFTDGEFDSPRNNQQQSLASLTPELVGRGIRVFLVLAHERLAAKPAPDSAVSNGDQVQDLQKGLTGTAAQELRAQGLRDQSQLIQVGPPYDPEVLVADAELFTSATGGESFAPADFSNRPRYLAVFRSDSLLLRMAALYSAIQDSYRTQLHFSRRLMKKQGLHLKLVDDTGKTIHSAVLLYPSSVYPAPRAATRP